MANIIFVNADKKKRAEDIYRLITGKRMNEKVSAEEEMRLKERFIDLLAEKKIALKDAEECLVAIYELMGGVIRTPEQQAKIKAKGNISRGKAKKEEVEVEEEDEDDDD